MAIVFSKKAPQRSERIVYNAKKSSNLIFLAVSFLVGYFVAISQGTASTALSSSSSSDSLTTVVKKTGEAPAKEEQVGSSNSIDDDDDDDDIGNSDPSFFDFPPSVKSVVINIGSNLDPIMPNKEMGPCAQGIAVEPIVGCLIPAQKHPQLNIIRAAVSSEPAVMSMRTYNQDGQSSSLSKPAFKASWNTDEKRNDGELVLVPVITLTSILNAMPDTVKIELLVTDMQGFDFPAVSAAGKLLTEKVTHIITEVFTDDVQAYMDQENDLCRDWIPRMTELGYTLEPPIKFGREILLSADQITAKCEEQLAKNPSRPIKPAKGHSPNANWVRNDVLDVPFPKCSTLPKWSGFTDEEYAECGF